MQSMTTEQCNAAAWKAVCEAYHRYIDHPTEPEHNGVRACLELCLGVVATIYGSMVMYGDPTKSSTTPDAIIDV